MFELIMIILGVLIIVGGVVTSRAGSRNLASASTTYQQDSARATRLIGRIATGVGVVLTLLFLIFSTTFTQTDGEAKVIRNADGSLAGAKVDPGLGFKAPWQTTIDFDLFSQTLTFAGDSQSGAPSYSGGTVNGYEVTAAVARGAQANFDLSVTYSLDPDKVIDIYKEFKTQERFTQQVIVNQTLDEVRKVPSAYTPVEFRGEKAGEARDKMLEAVQDQLSPYGVKVSVLNFQSVRYSDEVEGSIKAVEVAQQKEEEAQANLRATEVSAQARVVEAQAQADANAVLNANPLSDASVQQKYVEAIGNGKAVFVVPEGSTPLLTLPAQ